MQTYGDYAMDFCCTDIAMSVLRSMKRQLETFGDMYGNANGIGVQNKSKMFLRPIAFTLFSSMVKHKVVTIIYRWLATNDAVNFSLSLDSCDELG
jgi:hypothetical protein